MTKKALNLIWGRHRRRGSKHTEWHAPCGCAYHPEPNPHIHQCEEHGLAALDKILAIADRAAVLTWRTAGTCVEAKHSIAGLFQKAFIK